MHQNKNNMKNDGLYFKIGHLSPFTTDTYIYRQTEWQFYENNIKYTSKFNAGNWNQNSINDLIARGWYTIGDIRTNKHTWGLFLNMKTLDNLYTNKNIKSEIDWFSILTHPLVAEVFSRYEEYINDTPNIKTKYSYNITTTEDDNEIESKYVDPYIYSKLTKHQKHEIGWMFNWENIAKIKIPISSYVPLLDTGLYCSPNDSSKLFTKDELVEKIIYINAGILASETGSGKTASIIGLLSTDIYLNNDTPSLIIVTKNILYQWKEELEKFCPKLKVLFVETLSDFAKITNHNIILTYREIVCQNIKHLKKIIWCRVIFDEFHEITNTNNIQNENMFTILAKLKASFKWGITGTINDTDLITVNKMCKLLGFTIQQTGYNKDVSVSSYWSDLTKLFYKNGIRRNPKPNLPKLFLNTRLVYMSQIQKLICKSSQIMSDCNELCSHLTDFWKPKSNEIQENKNDQIIKYIMNKRQSEIEKLESQLKATTKQEEIQILNQRIKSYVSANDYFQEIIEVMTNGKYECPICLEESTNIENIVVTDCMHVFCCPCFDIFQDKQNFCVTCKAVTTDQNIVIHPTLKNNTGQSKIDKIIEEVNKIHNDEKIILFTQFDNLAKHICEVFDIKNIRYTVLKGIPSEINISLNKFKTDKTIKVLIMSIEQSASGLNITEASHVFFAHPIFGYTHGDAMRQYKQCIGRTYRYGQKKNVNVVFFIAHGSIETKVNMTLLSNELI